jgi:pyrophosphate--fructose-6-phosphate 1-phosphotransferase
MVFVPMFVRYEGRSGLPSEFDTVYCYSLGTTAACLVHNKQTGLMACVQVGVVDLLSVWQHDALA